MPSHRNKKDKIVFTQEEKEKLVERLMEVLGCASQSELEQLLHIDDGYLSPKRSGDDGFHRQTWNAIYRICEERNLPTEYILYGKGEIPLASIMNSGLVPVEVLSSAAIGHGLDDNMHEALPQARNIKLFPEELVNGFRHAFQVKGLSMWPTLNDEDYVGVDFDDREFEDEALFLIYRNYHGASVKRLQEMTGGMLIKSDNPHTENELVEHSKIEHDIRIAGRIAWIFGNRTKRKLKPDKHQKD